MADKEVSTFFEHGSVGLLERDFRSREAKLNLCMPCCLFLAASPSLLGHGLIDDFRIHHPLSVWIPRLSSDRFHPYVSEQVPFIADKSNVAVKQTAERTLQNFQDLIQFMPYPEDLIPTLPLGIYVDLTYRCNIDSMAKILIGVENTAHHGIAEFRFALAEVLTTVLHDIEKWESSRVSRFE